MEATWGRTRVDGRSIGATTLFDLASLTKSLVTAPLYMWAVARGALGLEDTLERFFPRAFVPPDKRAVTIRCLLSHSSGFPPYYPYYRELISLPARERRSAVLTRILATPLTAEPGEAAVYSDLGYILLGFLLEDVFGKPLDTLASEVLFEPLGLQRPSNRPALGFRRLEVPDDPEVPSNGTDWEGAAFAATEACPWRKRLLEGEVHDENAYVLGGVAGHAGLFGTARGIHRLLGFLWDVHQGLVETTDWSPEVVRTFWTRAEAPSGTTWTLGFDTPSGDHSSAGHHFTPGTVGHLGFTGTSWWFDLRQEILVILLTNRVYPSRGDERIKAFRPLLHNLIMESCRDFWKD